ncbi:discoidin domain-containing protein [Acetobacter oeni]|uniref:Uncharacterized protein n=1 Tax=Acetobacter oeni TaxID=304077 RepID=A0A511XL07_9PROT|nr:discoidin domain-containing protein [Acetobacter oeni]MBB3883225.1 hypothetical protein [Acetobacter oeni]GBR07257.1 hypothetical protein AA21952_2292 [Acetobacter oeni LMG 21952]GEN63626.1 hypothetical protein AOE01nite_18500 [Acetobacter oeni]
MSLMKTTRLYGYAGQTGSDPGFGLYKNAVMNGAALYKENGQIISDSAFFRGADGYQLLGAGATATVNVRIARRIEEDCFWLGEIVGQFGHFILSALSRIWALHRVPPHVRIAYSGAPAEELFKQEFIAKIFSGLGLTADRFLCVEGPCVFASVYIAEPSLNENYSVSEAYNRSVREIFSVGGPVDDSFVYITKHKMQSGVLYIENEEELCGFLEKNGVKCVAPEELSFDDQLKFWAGHRKFAGFSSSSFHLCNFFGSKDIILINRDCHASSNQLLLDASGSNRTLHLFSNDLVQLGRSYYFALLCKIRDVEAFGRSLLSCIDKFGSGALTATAIPDMSRTVNPSVLRDESFGNNLSRGSSASQSSVYHEDEGRTRTPEGVLSGYLTGSYQCHTAIEDNPWWQTDLGGLFDINEVRIYNRTDHHVIAMRCNAVSVAVSDDGVNFSEVHRHDFGGVPPGGRDGDPYRWVPAQTVTGRHVRITILSHTCLHFDQVEIFGLPHEVLL